MRTPLLKLLAGAFALSIKTNSTLTSDRTLDIDGNWAVGYIPQIDATDSTKLRWVSPGTLGGGTVTSFNLNANLSTIYSVATATTTPTLALLSQNSNLILASPDGSSGVPTFRSLVAADIPALPASKITSGTLSYSLLPVGTSASTVAAGNDSRFHTQNTDLGTTSSTFYIGGATGLTVKVNAGAFELRNIGDTAWADLVVKNLYVKGTQVIVDSNTVNIGDSLITLNSDFTGASPTENGGIEVFRDTATGGNAQVLWNETTDKWQVGLVSSGVYDVARYRTISFTSANITSNLLTITHNLGSYPLWRIYDNSGNVVEPADATSLSATQIQFDMTGLTVSGTWNVAIMG